MEIAINVISLYILVIMSGIQDMRDKLAQIQLVASISGEPASRLYEEVLHELTAAGFIPSKRAEGHALFPCENADILGLPHIRLGNFGTMISLWIRGPYDLNREKAEMAGLTAEELYERILIGARRAAQIFERFREVASSVLVSLPIDV
ncbi:MAG: hypothetical protein DRN90_07125 [Thermoproteota archaeon]|nr:MAG: hypothetical protein DRN90_07125 [Candidatus Korarchaeota archaeon]